MAESAYYQGGGVKGTSWPWGDIGPSYQADALVTQSQIPILTLTTLGEHVMEPLYGSKVMELVFESAGSGIENPQGSPLESLASLEISNAFLAWMPTVEYLRLSMKVDQNVEGLVTLDIDYRYLGQIQTSSTEVPTGGE